MPVARLLPQQGDIAGNIPQYRIKSALDGGECTVQNREIGSWAWTYDRRKLTPKRGQRGLMDGVYPIDDVKIVAAGSLPGPESPVAFQIQLGRSPRGTRGRSPAAPFDILLNAWSEGGVTWRVHPGREWIR